MAAVVQALHDGAPQLRLLVTSQVPLKLPIERVYRLGALAVPDVDATLDDASSHGAIALFVERAQAADRRFELNVHNLPAVIGLCAQLDGLALAIELAAARIPMLGVTALASSLDARLHLLTQGRRGAPQRQRTLRAALQWSYGLLNAAEATVFRRLGVFAGGFSLDMARQVVCDDPRASENVSALDEWDVVDALGGLVDRSLVAADTGDLPRYRLLDSARAFALEQLAAAGEDADMHRRHVRAVLQRFSSIDAACLRGALRVDEALAALEPDLDNAREALAWSLADADVLSAVSLAPALSFALNVPRYEERSRLWQATADCKGELPDKVKAAWALGYCSFWFRNTDRRSSSTPRRGC